MHCYCSFNTEMESENGSGKHVWLPQGDMPRKPKSKVRRQHEASETTAHHKKQLSFSTDDKPRELDMQPPKHSWSVLELKCLVEYIALYWACSKINETWPKFKNQDFWNGCAQYVSAHAQCSLRFGVAMRSKVTNYLKFSKIALPSFNTPSASGVERLDKVKMSTRADPGVFHANRASLPQRRLKSVRAQFHKTPERLTSTTRFMVITDNLHNCMYNYIGCSTLPFDKYNCPMLE